MATSLPSQPFSLLDQGDGFAKSGTGQMSELAGGGMPWLYLFNIYGGNPKEVGTVRGDYDLLWLDRGSIQGKILPWMIRRRGAKIRTIGSTTWTIPWNANPSVRVPILHDGKTNGGKVITNVESQEFSVGFASASGLLILNVGNMAKESPSPFITSLVWYNAEMVKALKIALINGSPSTMVPSPSPAGAVGFQLIELSDKMAAEISESLET